MATKPDGKIRKMHPNDRQSIEEQARGIKEQLEAVHNRETSAGESLDTAVLERQLQKKERILDRDDSLVARGAQKDKLSSRAKELEQKIRSEMPTRNEMWAKPGTLDGERAVQKNMAFEAKHGAAVREWQDIQSRLEPEDPSVCNVERIRPE
jgi:hypothetical protein